jgi:hypothetical protein
MPPWGLAALLDVFIKVAHTSQEDPADRPHRKRGVGILHFSLFLVLICVMQGAVLQADGSLRGRNIQMLRGGWLNSIAEPLIRKAGMHWLATWNETVPLFNMHRTGECTHYCSPGAYSVWVWRLWRLLLQLSVGASVQKEQLESQAEGRVQ